MNEEVDVILVKIKDWTVTKKDVLMLRDLADNIRTKVVLIFGIYLFIGRLINEDREETSNYFEKVYISGKIEELKN